MTNAFHAVFYWLVTRSLRCLLTVGAGVTRVDFAPLPEDAFVLASNHISHFDPPFLSGWITRKIDWIAMAELFGTSWSRAAFGWLDVIPVDRSGGDRQSLRTALARLAHGRIVGVFPEGGIRDGSRSMLMGGPFREGAVLLSARSGRPLVPVAILGSERLYNKRNWLPWRRARVYIAVGAPIFPDPDLSGSAARDALRTALAEAIVELRGNLVEHCGLVENDLPHSPQERMSEP